MKEKVKLSLNSVCDGTLNKEFMRRYPMILQGLKNDESEAVVTVKIKIARLKDSDTLLKMSGSVDVKMPTSAKKQSVYQFNADDFTIQSEKPQDPEDNLTILPFSKEQA